MVTLDGTKEAYKLPNVKKNNFARKIVMAITTGWLQLLFFIYKCFSMGHKYLRSRKKGKKLLISMGVGLLASIIFIIYEPDKSELLLDFSIMFILCTICTLVFSIKTFEEKDYSAFNFLQWYVAEQHEEEKLFSGILDKLNLLGEDGKGLFLIDKDLGNLAGQTA